MSADVSVALERLRTSTQRLNTACDQAAAAVREVEALLEDAQVGVPAYVKLWVSEGEEVGLCYARHTSGRFRLQLCRAAAEANDPEDCTLTPWTESSRTDKLVSFERLPALLVELAKNVDEQAAKAEQTVATVTAALPLPKKRKGA